MGVKSHLIVL